MQRIKSFLSRPHTTLFLSCDASDRLRYEMTRNCRVSCHLTEIGTLAIKDTINFLRLRIFMGLAAISLTNGIVEGLALHDIVTMS